MALYDGLPRRRGASARQDDETGTAASSRSFQAENLAPGIVWADVLAAIAADERARRAREPAEAA
ncbi:hypothetical protein CKY47_22980 [Saccharothrix yanglingensis]|uniref:Uncharacterized protein n=2 Tax=Saccharothrix yanglingensis TaxID=659496 RepID=A0ABU0X5B7_9PSEU|nr:hypothetical protein [Saccharothrix yanglingensis]